MSAGHTPGPWKVFKNHNPAPEYSTTWILDSQTRGHLAVLTVMDLNSSPKWREANPETVTEHEETLREVEANARLIAAAPALLAALEAIAGSEPRPNRRGLYHAHDIQNLQLLAQKAIARARSES